MFKKYYKKPSAVRTLLVSSFIIVLAFFGSYLSNVYAETKNVGSLTIEYPGSGPLFSLNNIFPGYSETKTLTVSNNGSIAHSFAVASENTGNDLAKVIYIEPSVDSVMVWSLTLSQLSSLPNGSKTVISSINPGQTKQVALKARFSSAAGNSYQGKSVTNFKFIVGQEEAEPVPGGEESSPPSPSGAVWGVSSKKVAQFTNGLVGIQQEEEKGKVEGEKREEEGSGSEQEDSSQEDGQKGSFYLYWLIPLIIFILLVLLWWFFWRKRRKEEEN